MKNVIITILALSLSSCNLMSETVASDRFSEYVGNIWLNGDKRTVLKIAEARLKENPEDLASLLVCFNFGSSYMETDRLKRLIPTIRRCAAKSVSPRFLEQKKELDSTLFMVENCLPAVTLEMVKSEAHKGDIKGKPLASLDYIKALEQDGLVHPITSEERAMAEGGGEAPKASGVASTTPAKTMAAETISINAACLKDDNYAIQVARQAVIGKMKVPENCPVKIARQDGVIQVTFVYTLDEYTLGPDYHALVRIDERTGAIIEVLVAS